MTRRAGLLEHAAMAAKTPGALWEQGTETRRTPALPRRDARGKCWRQATVQQLLADRAVARTPPGSASAPVRYGAALSISSSLRQKLGGRTMLPILIWSPLRWLFLGTARMFPIFRHVHRGRQLLQRARKGLG